MYANNWNVDQNDNIDRAANIIRRDTAFHLAAIIRGNGGAEAAAAERAPADVDGAKIIAGLNDALTGHAEFTQIRVGGSSAAPADVDYGELIARLKRNQNTGSADAGLVNPDGPEAATAIASLQRQLGEALGDLRALKHATDEDYAKAALVDEMKLQRDNAEGDLRQVRHQLIVHGKRADAAESALAAKQAECERLREAFEKSDKRKIWQDGFDAAKEMVLSVKTHATWGPKATPDDGLKLGVDTVKGVFARHEARTALSAKS